MHTSESILEIRDLSKSYFNGREHLRVLDQVQFEVFKGEVIAIIGPSGSGKSTLLGLCAGLDEFSEGDILFQGRSIKSMDEDARASLRNQHLGFIFQNFQLLPTLTALENVMVPLELKGDKKARDSAEHFLKQVGLEERMTHYPTQLSGGEQQRVGIARAFANSPSLLFADEPTGNLDTETGQLIEDLLFDLNRLEGTTLIVVTHDPDLAKRADRVLSIKGGRLQEVSYA